jgi:hypothetical protein
MNFENFTNKHVYVNQSNIVKKLGKIGEIDIDGATNISYREFDGESFTTDHMAEKIEEINEDIDKLQTKEFSLQEEYNELKDDNKEDTALGIKLDKAIDDNYNKIKKLKDDLIEIDKLEPQYITIDKWYAISEEIAELLIVENEVVLRCSYGTWWGYQESGRKPHEHHAIAKIYSKLT